MTHKPDVLIINRRYFPHGTFSTVTNENGDDLGVCIEKSWLDNKPFISCIPEGIYDLEPHESPKYGNVVALVNESLGVAHHKTEGKDRYACLLHGANKAAELQGCVGPGSHFGVLGGVWAVMNSKNTLKKWLSNGYKTCVIRAAPAV